jgi:hypothetical protein
VLDSQRAALFARVLAAALAIGVHMSEAIRTIYEQWHELARTRDVDVLINLYTDDAVFESPLVPAILDQESGVLNGRGEILRFLREGTKRRPNDLVRWHRSGQYFTDGKILIWEYPREAPDGDQIDILEVMEVTDAKISRHRIYWGWFGCGVLISSAVAKAKEG